jgi:hypothetical protein
VELNKQLQKATKGVCIRAAKLGLANHTPKVEIEPELNLKILRLIQVQLADKLFWKGLLPPEEFTELTANILAVFKGYANGSIPKKYK